MNELSLGQRSALLDAITKQMDIDSEVLWELTGKITEKQKKFLWALCFNNDIEELKKVIPELIKFYGVKEIHV